MKPTKLQIVLAYIASISLMLIVFHRPLGFADYWEWIFDAICAVAWIAFFILRKRQRATLSAASTDPAAPPQPNKKIMWLSLVLIIVTSLSSFLWLPYTGTALPPGLLIIISITSCVLCVTIYLIAWRHRHRV